MAYVGRHWEHNGFKIQIFSDTIHQSLLSCHSSFSCLPGRPQVLTLHNERPPWRNHRDHTAVDLFAHTFFLHQFSIGNSICFQHSFSERKPVPGVSLRIARLLICGPSCLFFPHSSERCYVGQGLLYRCIFMEFINQSCGDSYVLKKLGQDGSISP